MVYAALEATDKMFNERENIMISTLKHMLSGARLAIIGHENSDFDSVASGVLLASFLNFCGIKARFLIPDGFDCYAEKYLPLFGIYPDEYCGKPFEDEFLFLVDCHTTIYPNKVLGCIDHHPTSRKNDYPFYMNSPSSSCTLSVLRLSEKGGAVLTENDYAMTAMSIYMDTQSLKSSKLVPSDLDWLSETVRKYRIDCGFMIRCGYCMTDLDKPVDELSVNELKKYDYSGVAVWCSAIRHNEIQPELKRKIISAVEEKREKCGAALWIIIFTDPEKEISEVVRVTSEQTECRSYGRILSRSIDVMPVIEKEISDGNI